MNISAGDQVSIFPTGPKPWSPQWKLKLGSLIESGEGPLTDSIKREQERIEWFEAWIEPTRTMIRVDLKEGEVRFNSELKDKVVVVEGSPLTLIWHRRMTAQLAKADMSVKKFSCLFYAVGFTQETELFRQRIEYRIIADGRAAKVIHL